MATDPSHEDMNRQSSVGEDETQPAAAASTPPLTPGSYGGGNSSSLLFFADATLELSEAHDMAETPEPQRFLMETAAAKSQAAPSKLMEMPNLTAAPEEDTESPDPQNVASGAETLNATSTPDPKMTMERISSEGRPRNTFSSHPPRRPRRPRDIPWAVSWVLIVPLSFIWTMSYGRDYSFYTKSAQAAVFYSILLAYGATLVLGRLLYRTMGGGDGDDARHTAAHVVLLFAPISVAVYLLLSLVIYLKTPNAMGYALLPLAFLIRQSWALRQWRTQQVPWAALMCMALDVLSRSLRRSSFYRMVGALMGVQLCMIVFWKLAVFGALGHGPFWVLVALVSGKWLSGTVARILGYIASGGMASWFRQQSALMEEMEHRAGVSDNEPESQHSKGDDSSADYNVGYNTTRMPEEYTSPDASIYQSVLDLDEGIDDDYEAEDDGLARRDSTEWINTSGSTVKTFLIAAVSTSFGSVAHCGLLGGFAFGSVAHCGLLGGFAQFTWSVVRSADSISASLSHRTRGFRGMQIGQDGHGAVGVLWSKVVTKASKLARSFVRTNSDLAMCHVAAYYKSYQRASLDVMALVDASGVEPIIHDDMTTLLCSSVCGSISGLIVIIVGTILSHQRSDDLSDDAIVQSMLLAYIFCYTLLFTVMEPLRASIKAIYVCFAEHPQSLSQSFPLIYHRLSRISEANQV